MSLDLAGKSGKAVTPTAITSTAGFVPAAFNAAESAVAKKYIVLVDASATAVNLTGIAGPSSFPDVVDGDEVTFIKVGAGSFAVTMDFNTGANLSSVVPVSLGYVNSQGESYGVIADTANDKWIFNA